MTSKPGLCPEESNHYKMAQVACQILLDDKAFRPCRHVHDVTPFYDVVYCRNILTVLIYIYFMLLLYLGLR